VAAFLSLLCCNVSFLRVVALSNPHQILAAATLAGSNPRIGYLSQLGRSSNSLMRLRSPDDRTSYRSNKSGANDEASKPLSMWWAMVIPAINARFSVGVKNSIDACTIASALAAADCLPLAFAMNTSLPVASNCLRICKTSFTSDDRPDVDS
jgi:hypothetical protein